MDRCKNVDMPTFLGVKVVKATSAVKPSKKIDDRQSGERDVARRSQRGATTLKSLEPIGIQ